MKSSVGGQLKGITVYLPIGYPNAKSLLWVANIEKIPALLYLLSGLATISVRTRTMKNTDTLATRMLHRKGQITLPKSNSTMFLNSRAGRANLDTKLPNPLAWVEVMMFALPAMYPHNIIPKHSKRAGRSLSMDMLDERAEESGSSSSYEKLVVLPGASIMLSGFTCYAWLAVMLMSGSALKREMSFSQRRS